MEEFINLNSGIFYDRGKNNPHSLNEIGGRICQKINPIL